MSNADGSPPAFDPDALREKYRASATSESAGTGTTSTSRSTDSSPLHRRSLRGARQPPAADRRRHCAVIGGGFGGLIAAARLAKAGVKDIRIIEKGGDFGGTWYWNRYPGAQCDIESYIYLPLLEETGYIPKEKYSFARRDPGALRGASASTSISIALPASRPRSARCAGTAGREPMVDHHQPRRRHDARFVVMSNGPLNRPKLPGIPGIETFKGHSFHTSRWDYGYTGGDRTVLHKLADKRVAIIGTGATAIQCVPHWAAIAKHLYVFQRTPSSVDVRGNRPTDPEWVKTLTPGWQKRRMENFNALVSGGSAETRISSATAGPTSSAISASPPRRSGPGRSGARGNGPDDGDLPISRR